MSDSLKIAIAGLGTVGTGTIDLLQRRAEDIFARCGRRIEIIGISARDKSKDRGIDLGDFNWFDDPVRMSSDSGADVIIELIGGAGVAKGVVEAAFQSGMHVVTANKALIAEHGRSLAIQAEEKNLCLAYEAAVAGGIPIIKALREGLAGNRINRLYGILNGTCNYILSGMRDTGRNFSDVLAEAQELGYAESDPSFDVDGVDAAHKLAILACVAFGAKLDFESVFIEGIRCMSSLDIKYAEEMGYRVKLIGIAQVHGEHMEQRVHPCLVPSNSVVASVEGVSNVVVVEGEFFGRCVLEGQGAGRGPTASAVVSDLMDIASGRFTPTFGLPVKLLQPLPLTSIDQRKGSYYVRLKVLDETGVMADIGAAFRDEAISMESILQRGEDANGNVDVVIVTHNTVESDITSALRNILMMESVVEEPQMIRIESIGAN